VRHTAFALLLFAPALFAGSHRFHANATPIDGYTLALPADGDMRVSTVDRYDDGVVRFERAVSSVRGVDDGGMARTEVAVTMTNVDIAGRVHADEIVARVFESQRRDEAEPEISFEGSRIRNLTIDGRPLDVTFDTDRLAPTYAAMKRDVERYYGLSSTNEAAGSIRDSIASISDERRKPATAATAIVVPGLGTLYLGEVDVKFGERKLTMIRFEPRAQRGKAPGRSVSITSVEGNGTNTWP
jgi:hypothetical protein